MTTKEIMEQAHMEAKRRGVPVVQVLAEQVLELHVKNRDVASSMNVACKPEFALQTFGSVKRSVH